MLWMDLEETNKPMSSAHRLSVNSRGPRTKPCEYWWQKARGEVLVLLTQESVFFYCSLFFEHGCSEDDERNEVVVLQTPLWVFLPQWQMMKKDTHPSLLISFFTPTMTARPHKRDEALSSICTSPIIHLVCPQTFCIRIVSNFSWGDWNIQQKLKTKVLPNFGGINKVYYKRCANVECCFRKAESLFTLLLNRLHSHCW